MYGEFMDPLYTHYRRHTKKNRAFNVAIITTLNLPHFIFHIDPSSKQNCPFAFEKEGRVCELASLRKITEL